MLLCNISPGLPAPENVGRTLSLTIEYPPAETEPRPVLTMNGGQGDAQVRLSWPESRALAQWLTDTADRWEPWARQSTRTVRAIPVLLGPSATPFLESVEQCGRDGRSQEHKGG